MSGLFLPKTCRLLILQSHLGVFDVSSAIGSLLPLTPEQLKQLSCLIGDLLTREITITAVHNVKKGQTSGLHFVAKTSADNLIGIKCTKRGDKTFQANERLASELAVLVSAPNATQIVHLENIPFIEAISRRPANISEWMKDATTFADLFEAGIESKVHDGGDSFFDQFGQWMCFGLMFGIRDRDDENWVWSLPHHTLAMIDFEHAFESPLLSEYTNIFFFLSSEFEEYEKQTNVFSTGYGKMWAKCVEFEEQLNEKLDQAKIKIQPAQYAPDKILPEFLGATG